MDLTKNEKGFFIGTQKIDSLGTFVELTYVAEAPKGAVFVSDSMYNGSLIRKNDEPICIIGNKGVIMNTDLKEGDIVTITPPGGFSRILHIHFNEGA